MLKYICGVAISFILVWALKEFRITKLESQISELEVKNQRANNLNKGERMELSFNDIVGKAKQLALGQYLSEYPANTPYINILDMVFNEDEAIEVWEPFESYTGPDMVQLIEDLKDLIIKTFMEVK